MKQVKAGMSHQRMLRERDITVDDLLFIIIIIDNIIINKYYLSWIDECWTKTRKNRYQYRMNVVLNDYDL